MILIGLRMRRVLLIEYKINKYNNIIININKPIGILNDAVKIFSIKLLNKYLSITVTIVITPTIIPNCFFVLVTIFTNLLYYQ